MWLSHSAQSCPNLIFAQLPSSTWLFLVSDLPPFLSLSSPPPWLTAVLDKESAGHFEGKNNTVVDLEDGDSLLLPCNVLMKRKKTVTWLRYTLDSKVPELLTVDNTTYTSDDRVKMSYIYPNNWGLQIENMERKDSGSYVCQISTHPPLGLHTSVIVTGM